MKPRVIGAVGALALAMGCLSQPVGSPEPMPCEATPPRDAEYADDLRENENAYEGTYQLMLVATQPRGVTPVEGTLHLESPDSSARRRRPHIAGLIGWFDTDDPRWPWREDGARRDPRVPGAQLTGLELRLGAANVMDGATDRLHITARSPLGFWGWWVEDTGIAVPIDSHPPPARAGYFCAIRTPVRDSGRITR